jgi:integrase
MAKIVLKHVNQFRDRHGRMRYYFRQRGAKATPLPGLPGSEEFMSAYAMAVAAVSDPSEIGASRTLPGTINALVAAYYRSSEWNSLADDSRHNRRHIIERFRAKHAHFRVATLKRHNIEQMLSQIATSSGKREWLKAIRALLRFAVPTMLKVDPTEGIKVKVPTTKGHHSWTDEEIAQYRAYWPLGTQQRLVLEFALETVSRRGEVVGLGPQHVKNGWIHIKRTHGSDDVVIPISPELQTACDAMPKSHLTYIVSANGKPLTKGTLGRSFSKWATEAGLPSRCRLHGLKKAGMTRLAVVGNFIPHELMAFSGHKTLSEVQRYTEAADKKRLAESGMAKLRERTKGDPDCTNIATQIYKPAENA